MPFIRQGRHCIRSRSKTTGRIISRGERDILSNDFGFGDEEERRAKVNERLKKIGKEYKGTTHVMHIVRLPCDEVGYDKIKEYVVRPLDDLTMAIHYGCHLLKPSRIMKVDHPNNPEAPRRTLSICPSSCAQNPHGSWVVLISVPTVAELQIGGDSSQAGRAQPKSKLL